MFSRSADHAEISQPAVAPEGSAAPGPPPGRSSQQRHFDWIFVAVVLILVGGAIGVLLFRNHASDARAARAQARADASARAQADASASAAAQVDAVKQAYLSYWDALGKAYLLLSTDPLGSYTTAAGSQQEDDTLKPFKLTGFRYLLTADHDIRVVVYAGGQIASVDDNLVQHLTAIEPTTLRPSGAQRSVPLHSSYALMLQNGHWVVDSLVGFGSDGSDGSMLVSYAAIARRNPLQSDIESEIAQIYLRYWDLRRQAYSRLDPTLLAGVATGAPLQGDLDFLRTEAAKKQTLSIQFQHNFRIAQKDPDTAYVYDTLLDSSFSVDSVTHQNLPADPPTVRRETTELRRSVDGWKIDLVGSNK